MRSADLKPSTITQARQRSLLTRPCPASIFFEGMDGESANEGVLEFVKACFRERKIIWTYHVNMRLGHRRVTRGDIVASTESMEIIEAYPRDRFLPCYLLLAEREGKAIHVVVAVDVPDDNVRIVTAYEPDPHEWDSSFKIRRKSP